MDEIEEHSRFTLISMAALWSDCCFFKRKFETRYDSQYALPKIIEPSSSS